MRSLTTLLLVSAGVVVWATNALAQPDPRMYTMDAVIVGSPLGLPISGVPPGFDVTVKDESLNPRPNAFVSLDFSGSGIRLYTTQASGTTINCASEWIARVTDAQGMVNFVPRFGGWNNANAVDVQVDGVSIGHVKARSLDYDKDGRVGLNDLALFTHDLLNDAGAQRSDFDQNGSTGLGDMALFSQQLLVGGSAQPLCP